ncbi:MAG: oligosaccharide flippase family protein [Acidimicrobiales bacterium]
MPADAPVVSARRELIGRGSVYTLASAVQAASMLLVLPVVTRILAPSPYGFVVTAGVVAQLVSVMASLGINSSVMLEYFEGGDGPARARRLVGVVVLVSLLVVGVTELTGPLWSRGFAEIPYGLDLRLAIWSALPLAVLGAAQSMLRSMGRPVAYVCATLTATVGGHALGALLVVATDGGATAYLSGVLIGATAGALAGLAQGGIARPTKADQAMVRRALRVGLPLIPHVVAIFALLAADRLVIEQILGLRAAGRYQVAYLIGGAGVSLFVAVNNAWSPLVFGADPERRWSVLASTTRDLERLTPALIGLIGLTAPVVVGLAAPAAYDPAALTQVTVVVAASALPFLWYLASVHVVLFCRRTGVLARATPMATVLAVAANVVVLGRFGLMGAAVVTVASYGFLAWRVRRAADRLAAVPWDRAGSRRTLVAVIAVVALALVLPASGPWIAVRAAVATALVGQAARQLATPSERAPSPA